LKGLWRNARAAIQVILVVSLLVGCIPYTTMGTSSISYTLQSSGYISSDNSEKSQQVEVGLRTDCFWDSYVKNPSDFLRLTDNKVNTIYFELPWVKELFTNFDPNNLDKLFAQGNWGYGYTFRDYVGFFRSMKANGIQIVFAIWGLGSSTKTYLNFFVEYPESAIDSKWVNPEYVDVQWNGKTFLQVYAEKINAFASFVGIPAIVSVEDWRYPEYLMQYSQLTELRAALKSLNQTNDVWMPPVAFSSAKVADFNDFKGDHPWTWEFSLENATVGGSDVLLQNVWDYAGVYHSAVNVAGELGAQMSKMPFNSGIVLKLYWGGSELNTNNPDYSVPLMKRKLEDIITASYLTRIITPDGEYCPVKGFVLVYKPPPTANLTDMLDILQFAKDMAYLRTAKVGGPVLEIPKDLGYATYNDRSSPLGGYMIGKGMLPFKFVYEGNVGYVNSTEKIVHSSAKDYSSEFGLNFTTSRQCTWITTFSLNNEKFYAIFHDGGYEGGVYNSDGTYQPTDKTSYLQNTAVRIDGLIMNVAAETVTIVNDQGKVLY
jgi:hypothetical protein